MDEIEDKIVEIARFQQPAEAQTLIALLKSEGIECYLRNELSSQLMAGYLDVGGARIEILESDVARALEVMEAGGYDIPLEDEEADQIQTVGGWTRHIPFLRNFALEKQIVIFFMIIAIFLALLIFFGSQYSSN